MKNKLQKIKKEILDQFSKVNDSRSLRDLELKYLSRKGEFTSLLKGLKDLGAKEKKEAGMLANEIKREIEAKVEALKDLFEISGKKNNISDVTLPGEKIKRGHLNPLTIVQNDLADLFTSMGFMVLEGVELESDYYCFEALNIPKHHPARDMQDTFYIDQKNKEGEYDMVMRTHTSPMQVRAMQKYGAPIKTVVLGRAFRSEAIDACHEHTFYQIEGLMVDKDISIANFKAVVREMLSGIFKQDVKVRLRPGYFPFVEPGFELDMSCTICGGKKCPACKHSGWLEIGGSGMVHPNVLKAGKVDPNKYSGFAFGYGIERLAMMKYGISDIRLFESGDLRFINQF